MSSRPKVKEEVSRAALVRSFDYLEQKHPSLCEMDSTETSVALIAQAVASCRTLSKPPPEAAITEFCYRVMEEYPSFTFADLTLFWRKFTAGELNDKPFSFAGPGLPELMACWEAFQMQRAGVFEQKHEAKKKQDALKDAPDEFWQKYSDSINKAIKPAVSERNEMIVQRQKERAEHARIITSDYNRYLSACESRGLTREQAAARLSYDQYLLDRQTCRLALRLFS